jgi:hypothetical protein
MGTQYDDLTSVTNPEHVLAWTVEMEEALKERGEKLRIFDIQFEKGECKFCGVPHAHSSYVASTSSSYCSTNTTFYDRK